MEDLDSQQKDLEERLARGGAVGQNEALDIAVVKNAELQHEIDSLHQNLQDISLQLKSEILERELHILDLETEIEITKRKVADDFQSKELESAFKALEGAYTETFVECDKLRTQLESLNGTIESQSRNIQKELTWMAGMMAKSAAVLEGDKILLEDYDTTIQSLENEVANLSEERTELREAFETLGKMYQTDKTSLATELESVSSKYQKVADEFAEASKFLVPSWRQLMEARKQTPKPSASATLKERWNQILLNAANAKAAILEEACSEPNIILNRTAGMRAESVATLHKIFGSVCAICLYFLECEFPIWIENLSLNEKAVRKDKSSIRWMAYTLRILCDSVYWILGYLNYATTMNYTLSAIFDESMNPTLEDKSFQILLENLFNNSISPCLEACLFDSIAGASGDVSGAEEFVKTVSAFVNSQLKENSKIIVGQSKALSFLFATRLEFVLLSFLAENFDSQSSDATSVPVLKLLTLGANSILSHYEDSVFVEVKHQQLILIPNNFPLRSCHFKTDVLITTMKCVSYAERAGELGPGSGVSVSDFSPISTSLISLRDSKMAINQILMNLEKEMDNLSAQLEEATSEFVPFLSFSMNAEQNIGAVVSPIPTLHLTSGRPAISPRLSVGRSGTNILSPSVAGAPSPRGQVHSTEELNKLKRESEDLQAQVARLSLEVSQLRVQNSDLSGVAKERKLFVDKITDQSKNIVGLQNEKNILISDLTKLHSDLKQKEEILSSLQQRQATEMAMVPGIASRELVHLKAVVKKLSNELFESRLAAAERDWAAIETIPVQKPRPLADYSEFVELVNCLRSLRSDLISTCVSPLKIKNGDPRENLRNCKDRIQKINQINKSLERLTTVINKQLSQNSTVFDDWTLKSWIDSTNKDRFTKVATVHLDTPTPQQAILMNSLEEFSHWQRTLLSR